MLLAAGGFYSPSRTSTRWAARGRGVRVRGLGRGERKVLYWHDPMVPGARFDKPGKSPFMDMQLVPVYADEASDSGVKVSPTIQQNLGIRTAIVKKGRGLVVLRCGRHCPVR